MSNYTPEQHRAIHSDANLVVTAGAGAGKTRVLTQRWIRLLMERDLDIDQVVAITFTEKAAAEMRERCRKELRTLAAQGNARAADLLERMDEARISTFHSFCQSLLRLYPVEAGLDPDFAVADDLAAGLLLSEVIDQHLTDTAQTADETIITLLTRFGRTRLASHLERLIGQMRNLGETPSTLRTATAAAIERLGDKGPLLTSVRAAVEALLAYATKPGSKGREQQDQLAATWAALDLASASIADLRAMADPINANAVKPKKPLVDAIDALAAHDATQAAADLGLAVLDLMEQALDRYQARKAQLDILDFSDLIDRLRRLLAESPAVRSDIAQQGLIFLNDEVQDTDPGQWAVIRQMLVPPDKAELPPGRVFIVGDPKQSIYRFRGARVDIFAAMTDDVAPNDDHRVGLMKNFRSQAGLIDLVNSLFSQIMAAPGAGAVPYAPMEPHRDPAVQTAELLLSRSMGAEGRREEAAAIARRIRKLVEGGQARYGDVAILVQAMTHVRTYATALAAADVPYYVVAGDGFFQAQEVADIENLLRVLDVPTDAIALAGWLRSPHVGLSDDALVAMGLHEGGLLAAWVAPGPAVPLADAPLLARARRLLPRLRALAWQEPLPRLLPALYEELSLYPVLLAQPDGQSAVANLDKLAAMVGDFASLGRHQFPDLLRWLRTARELEAREGLAAMAEEGGNTVRIMTVHKSKGLEFPVVILPDIGRSQKSDAPEVILHPQIGLAPKLLDDDGAEIESGLRNLAVDLNKQESEQEFRRLFYVAATRARDYLILSAIQPKSADGATWLHWLFTAAEADVAAPPAELVIGPVTLPVRTVGEEAPLTGEPSPEAMAEAEAAPTWPDADHLVPTPIAPTAPPASTPTSAATLAVQRLLRQTAPFAQPGPRNELQTSASRLMVYQDCPRKYYLQTSLGLPDLHRAPSGWDALARDPSDLADDIAAESILEPTVRGTIVHAVCERLTNPADLEALIAQAVQDHGIDLTHPDVETAIRAPLRRYIQSPFFERIRAARHVYSELSFQIQIGGMNLEGFIDKVLEEDDGLVIIDFKTNHVQTAEQIDEAAAHYRLQMQIYALAAQERLGKQPIKDVLLYFLAPGEARSCRAHLDEAATRAQLQEMGEHLRSAAGWADFPPNLGHCARCQYQKFCHPGT